MDNVEQVLNTANLLRKITSKSVDIYDVKGNPRTKTIKKHLKTFKKKRTHRVNKYASMLPAVIPSPIKKKLSKKVFYSLAAIGAGVGLGQKSFNSKEKKYKDIHDLIEARVNGYKS